MAITRPSNPAARGPEIMRTFEQAARAYSSLNYALFSPGTFTPEQVEHYQKDYMQKASAFGKIAVGAEVRIVTLQRWPEEQRNPDTIAVTHQKINSDGSISPATLYKNTRYTSSVTGVISDQSSPSQNLLTLHVADTSVFGGITLKENEYLTARVIPFHVSAHHDLPYLDELTQYTPLISMARIL